MLVGNWECWWVGGNVGGYLGMLVGTWEGGE